MKTDRIYRQTRQLQPLPFRSVNRPGRPGYDPDLQRHHLIPRQARKYRSFSQMFEYVGDSCIRYNDFRTNGLLLPANAAAAIHTGLPVHRGPHRHYNTMVMERIGQIERSWSARRLHMPYCAREEAIMRLELLQQALRRRLLDPVRP